MIPWDHPRRTCATCGCDLAYRARIDADPAMAIYSMFCPNCVLGQPLDIDVGPALDGIAPFRPRLVQQAFAPAAPEPVHATPVPVDLGIVHVTTVATGGSDAFSFDIATDGRAARARQRRRIPRLAKGLRETA